MLLARFLSFDRHTYIYIINKNLFFTGEIHWLQRSADGGTASTIYKWLSGGPHGDCVCGDGHQSPAGFR